jgi:hypothetical protein
MKSSRVEPSAPVWKNYEYIEGSVVNILPNLFVFKIIEFCPTAKPHGEIVLEIQLMGADWHLSHRKPVCECFPLWIVMI